MDRVGFEPTQPTTFLATDYLLFREQSYRNGTVLFNSYWHHFEMLKVVSSLVVVVNWKLLLVWNNLLAHYIGFGGGITYYRLPEVCTFLFALKLGMPSRS
jgi:hypothetical protein